MKEKLLVLLAIVISTAIGFMAGQIVLIKTQKPVKFVQKVVDRSLDAYTIENLSKAKINPSKIEVVKELKDYPSFTSNEFSLTFNPNPSKSDTKKTSGLINIPKGQGKYPILVMIRGYVAPKDYFIGNGTINASLFFAKNGFITVSPDFLGYGDSDKEPDNIFEARFQTYTTAMAVLKSLDSIPNWDGKNIEIWAHSNGGQITLATLEVTGVTYPTVLWAPVSSPFPFSILYYSDEADDKGKMLRRELAKFEDVYDSDLYSLTNYLDKIKATIELNQGTADDAVPVSWSDRLAKTLKDNGLDITYNVYPGASHEMDPLWNKAITKDLEFLKKNLK